MGELQTHYDRLERLANRRIRWQAIFSGAWQVFAGGLLGSLLGSADGSIRIAFAVATAACFVAWVAIRDTDVENVSAICLDYKTRILDTFEIVEDEGE